LDGEEQFFGFPGNVDENEIFGRVEVVFPGFVDDSQVAAFGGGFIGQNPVNGSHFEVIFVTASVDTNGEAQFLAWFVHNAQSNKV